MESKHPSPLPPAKATIGLAERIHRGTVLVLLVVMAAELVLILLDGLWLSAFLVVVIMMITMLPVIFQKKLPVVIPPEFQLLAISLLGWWYMRQRKPSFIETWIRKFIASNPRLFRS